jgi:hypothetical protein
MERKIVISLVITLLIGTTITVLGVGTEHNRLLNPIDALSLGGLDEQVDQSQTTHCGWGAWVFATEWEAQSFKPSVPTISKIKLRMFYGNDPPNYELIFCLKEDLYGDNLVQMSKTSEDLLPSSSWVEFDFPDIKVEIDHTYYIVCMAFDGSESNSYNWLYQNWDKYTRGCAYYYDPSQDVWKRKNDRDYCFITYYDSDPPVNPDMPSGPSKCQAGKEIIYTTSTTDPDPLDYIYFKWDWGDGNFSDWLGPYNSSETCEASHLWVEQGTYNIKVKAKDGHRMESEWSDPLAISVPKNKPSFTTLFSRFLENYPRLFPLLRFLFDI